MDTDGGIRTLIRTFRAGHPLQPAEAVQLKILGYNLPLRSTGIQEIILKHPQTQKLTEFEQELINIKKRKMVNGLTTPIQNLPPELLSYIFELAVDTNVILGRPGVRGFGAISLSAVCSHWRDVTMGRPALWATLSLYLRHGAVSDPTRKRAKAYLQEAVKRAQNAPLSVIIEFHLFPSFLHPDAIWTMQFLPLLDILMSRTWRSAIIRHTGSEDCFSSLWDSKILSHLQFVQNLEFDVKEPTYGHGSHPLFRHSNFSHFPNLRTLLLPFRNQSFSKIPISYHHLLFHPQLTHLRICTGTDYVNTLKSLRSCATSLETLSLNIFLSITPYENHSRKSEPLPGELLQQESSIICFRALKELVIVATDEPATNGHPLTCVQSVLGLVECPSLVSLTLQSLVGPEFYVRRRAALYGSELGLATFKDFVVRSELSMKLRAFAIRGFEMSDDQALAMLEDLPGLRELTVSEINAYKMGGDVYKVLTGRFFERFRITEEVDAEDLVFLPRLQMFRILVFRKLGEDFEEFVENRGRRTEIYLLDG
ncbi:hypothetical protein E1B28_002090 [Marasmius oreades]|uniref:F-box domain-containing protein n=1 Tax=Marasmius oreades TaxID=181124 RepID=A0A9P7UMR1_9AGAR|nr:uncharacterized protein E1B28_002090 [Marasmius oreades]KAG7086131.1 hypothetical protein E1B28_002090 [Marasmius oreades]